MNRLEADAEAKAREDLEKIFYAAIAAVDPARLIDRALSGELQRGGDIPALIQDAGRIFLVAIGKAAAAMAAELERHLTGKLADAIAVIPAPGTAAAEAALAQTKILIGAHPVPDRSSVAAASAATAMLRQARAEDLVIVALSGGASAMFAAPAAGISLEDKVAVTRSLLNAGAPIREFNLVRKHLSAVKGGNLLRACGGARVLGLILSDVPGNDLATIGSGLTTGDPSTFGDAIAVLKRRGVWGRAPEAVRDHLELGAAGDIPETVKPGDPLLDRVINVIIGDNRAALSAAADAAKNLGYAPEPGRELRGEADEAGRLLASDLCSASRNRVCILAGGEPVVSVHGNGRGGRAQQCALAAAIEFDRVVPDQKIAVLFAGTDGVDGPTDAAGAFASPSTIARGESAGADAAMALARNDAYNFFLKEGGLFRPGPTGTNVSDLAIALVNY
ncbi:MAG TPA: DUF4147 domain-containing protein [Candidatus Binataceae bacterium]|nr:DUF4147 domain-containing protein [Candidatus Binataceae bacterium]